jgi:hypothetical protein
MSFLNVAKIAGNVAGQAIGGILSRGMQRSCRKKTPKNHNLKYY